MLLKEKLLLSNCDSVRKLPSDQLKKRFLTGMTFGDGVVLSPNILIDNLDFHRLLARRNVVKYLNEEGYGKLVLRGFNLSDDMDLLDYYQALPSQFIFSSLAGSPAKADISIWQEAQLITRIKETQAALNQLGYSSEKIDVSPDSLTTEIRNRLADDSCVGHFFDNPDQRQQFLSHNADLSSRSDWYKAADEYFRDNNDALSAIFKTELIDPAYNSLFAKPGEGFLQDDIKVINKVPGIILDAGVSYKSLRNELSLLGYALNAFEIISSLGTTHLYKILSEQAIGYIEEQLSDRGADYFNRKNWFGMYHKLRNTIGLEVK